MPSHQIPRIKALAGTVSVAVVAALASALPGTPAAAEPDHESLRVVIEFDGPSASGIVGPKRVAEARTSNQGLRSTVRSAYAQAENDVEQQQDATLQRVSSAGVDVRDRQRVTGVLNGVVATIDGADLATVRRQNGVARVTEDAPIRLLDETNIAETGAPEVWDQTDGHGSAIKGNGVTVAVLDSGVDYSLPDLGGGFGEGHRVVDGHDFVNDDADPMDDNAHGTHVAGIVGAGGENITGMAPEVSLTAWKVLDARGSGNLADALLALEQSTDPLADHPADVVNMSFGAAGDGTDPLGRAATAAVASGTVVVAAAGNTGPTDQTIGTPAAAPGVIAVGATVTGVTEPTLTLKSDGSRKLDITRFPMSANPGPKPVTAELVDAGDGFDADYEGIDAKGKIAVVSSRAAESLGQVMGGHLSQAEAANRHGAVGLLMYSPSPTDPRSGDGPVIMTDHADAPAARVLEDGGFDLRQDDLVMMSISAGDYRTFKQDVVDGTATATIGSEDPGDAVAGFSSRGPSDAMTLKPEIVAPGFEVLSDVPTSFGVEGDQYRFSGTSMASPHVAGAAGLMVQARPDDEAEAIRRALVGSAQPLEGTDDTALSPATQGAGKLDVAAAVDQSTTATPDAVSFGLTDMGPRPTRTESVTVHNDGDRRVDVRLTAAPSAASTGNVALSAKRLRIPAGGSASVRLTLNPADGDVEAETSGVVVGSVSDGTTLRIPYAGFTRPLVLEATPNPATGSSEIFAYSPVAPDGPPTVTATAPSGAESSTTLTPVSTSPGWYRGTVPLKETGTYELRGRTTSADRTLTGSARVHSLGGDDLGQWEHVGVNGAAYEVAVSPDADGTALATLTTSPQPFITTDRGRSWKRIRSMPVAGGWGMPVADSSSPGAFWLVLNSKAGNVTLDPTYNGRILHTSDAGKSWTVLPFPDVAVEDFVQHGTTLAAITSDGAYVSQDSGATWNHVAHAWQGSLIEAEYAGDSLLVEDGPQVWRLDGDRFVPAYEPENGLRVVALGGDQGGAVAALSDETVVGTDDGGRTWDVRGDTGQSYISDLSLEDGITYVSGFGFYSTSTDYGASWTQRPFPVRGPLATDVDRWPGSGDDSVLLSLENTGIYDTGDGEAWNKIGVSGTTISSVDTGTDADGTPVLRTADREGIRTRALSDLSSAAQTWESTGNEGYIGRSAREVVQSDIGDERVWRTRKDGTSRAHLDYQVPGQDTWTEVGPSAGYTPLSIALSPHDQDTLAVSYTSTAESGVMVSSDAFATWRSHMTGIRINDLAFDPKVPDRLWAATDNGLFRYDDLGATRTRVTTARAESVLVDPDDPDRILVGEHQGLQVSDDGGKTFTRPALPFDDVSIGSLTKVVPESGKADEGLLMAGSAKHASRGLAINGGGVFVSADGGLTWRTASAGLDAMSVRSLDVSADGTMLYAGTDDGGVFQTSTDALRP